MRSVLTVNTAAATKDLTVLAALKAELGITGTGDDALLSSLIRQASDAINAHCSRPEGFGAETVTETFWLECSAPPALILARDLSPAIATVTEDGTALTAGTDFALDGSLLLRLRSDQPSAWSATKVVVGYSAGYTLLGGLPYDLERACLDFCTTLWASRGRDRLLRSEAVDGVMSDSYLDPRDGAFGLPPAVAGMLASYRRIPV